MRRPRPRPDVAIRPVVARCGAALGWILAALALGAAPAAATVLPTRPGAVHRPPVPAQIALPTRTTVQIGPIRAGDGFRLYVEDDGCGGPDPQFELVYLRSANAVQLSHLYSGPAATCAIRRSPVGVELTARLPGVFDVAVAIAHVGAALPHPGLPAGCAGPYGPERPATATGTIEVRVHPARFGTVSVHHASARLFPDPVQTCPAQGAPTAPQIVAAVGADLLDLTVPEAGAPQLTVLDPSGDRPTPALAGSLLLQLSGAHATSPRAGGGRGVGSGTALTRGSLTFTPLPACPGFRARNGTLSGALSILDPVLGTVRIDGAEASEAYLASGSQRPGLCNGPGSQPVVPDLITNCNSADSDCSVSAGTGVATLFDETSAGTQTITAETVSFGDGSSVSIGHYGSVVHGYASPGTYAAAVTVTTATGATATATTPVVIEP